MSKTYKILFLFSVCLNIVFIIFLFPYLIEKRNGKDYFNFNKYEGSNVSLMKEGKVCKVVFIGNSITENWIHTNTAFFTENGYINRGIGGQTSSQLLLRFYQDVIELKPKVVVINAGANDIGKGDGFYDLIFTLNNIKSMADIAKANNIKVILTAVLPAEKYKISYFTTIENIQPQIDNLNKFIKSYARMNDISFVDYNTDLRDDKGYFKDDLCFDGVHPNLEGYKVMEGLLKPIIDSILAE